MKRHRCKSEECREFTALELAILRRVSPVIFKDDRWGELLPANAQRQAMELSVEVLPDALEEVGRRRFHINELLSDHFMKALLLVIFTSTIARVPGYAPFPGTMNWRKVTTVGRPRMGEWVFCSHCGAPKFVRQSFLANGGGRFCTRQCAAAAGWFRYSGKRRWVLHRGEPSGVA